MALIQALIKPGQPLDVVRRAVLSGWEWFTLLEKNFTLAYRPVLDFNFFSNWPSGEPSQLKLQIAGLPDEGVLAVRYLGDVPKGVLSLPDSLACAARVSSDGRSLTLTLVSTSILELVWMNRLLRTGGNPIAAWRKPTVQLPPHWQPRAARAAAA